MQMPPDLVIFDCDGVLVDSERITNEVMRQSFAQHGLELDLRAVMRLCVGGTIPGVFEKMRAMGADLPASWVTDIYPMMHDALATQVEAVTGVVDVLDHLDRAGIAYAVASNGPHAKMQITLTRAGLMARFKGRIVSREDVERPKPAPDVFLAAAQLAGVSPARSVVVEDSATGAQAGQAAKMRVLGYAGDCDARSLAPHCDAVFSDMSALPGLLQVRAP